MRYPGVIKNINTPELMNIGLRDEAHVRKLNYQDWDRFERLVKRYKNGDLLDVGCLNSPICAEMKAKHPDSSFYALDHAQDIIEYFQKICPNVYYVCSDCYNMPFTNESFTYIVASEILEHLDHPEKLISEVYRLLKPGGTLAFTVPLDERLRQQGGELHVNWFSWDEAKGMFPQFTKVELEEYDCGAIVKFIIGYVTK